MNRPLLHSWNLKPKEAVALQRQLAENIKIQHVDWEQCQVIASADVSYNRFSNIFYASVVLWHRTQKTIIETASAVVEVNFPYVPGLLSFRECPALLHAFAKLKTKPHAVMVDGHGLAHPRRIGIACHIGLWLDLPTFGCAKSKLCGEFTEPSMAKGSDSPLLDNEEQIGVVLRSKDQVKPIFVSAGHKINLPSAVALTKSCLIKHRIPEPTRLAHLAVNAFRKEKMSQSQS